MKTNRTENALSPQQQKSGRDRFLWFIRINTVSFGCLADSILILYAIKIGADDFCLGLVASFIYLSMPLMIFSKRLIGRIGAAHAYGISWVMRNLFASFMAFVPMVITKTNHTFGLIFLIFSSFGFFAFRSIGFTANTPLIGEITDKNNRGQFLSKIWLQYNIFYFITLLVLLFVLKQSETIHTFQFIIIAGFVFGVIGSVIVYGIPESDNPKLSGRSSFSRSLKSLWNNLRYRKLLYAWSAATVGNVLCIPFSVVAVKNGYGVSDFNALFFVLCQLIGGVVASSLNIWIMDRVGPRPMLILYNGGLMLTALLWIFSPLKLNIIYLANIFFINGMALAGTNTAISHYFLVVVPERERVVVNMFFLIFSGAATGLAGTILGGGLLKLLSSFDLTALTVYRTFFSFILIFLCPLFLIIKKLDRLDSYRVKEVLKIFLSFRDLRSLFMLHRFERE